MFQLQPSVGTAVKVQAKESFLRKRGVCHDHHDAGVPYNFGYNSYSFNDLVDT